MKRIFKEELEAVACYATIFFAPAEDFNLQQSFLSFYFIFGTQKKIKPFMQVLAFFSKFLYLVVTNVICLMEEKIQQ